MGTATRGKGTQDEETGKVSQGRRWWGGGSLPHGVAGLADSLDLNLQLRLTMRKHPWQIDGWGNRVWET